MPQGVIVPSGAFSLEERMKLDVDELLAALEQPSITIAGEEHVFKYPSFLERLRNARLLKWRGVR